MRLARRDDEYVISVNGKTLMSSRKLGSEVALATSTAISARAASSLPNLIERLSSRGTVRFRRAP